MTEVDRKIEEARQMLIELRADENRREENLSLEMGLMDFIVSANAAKREGYREGVRLGMLEAGIEIHLR